MEGMSWIFDYFYAFSLEPFISIGNYFLAAAQGFFRSLPSAIFLFSSITNSQVIVLPSEILNLQFIKSLPQAHILPVIVTNHTVTIAAELVSQLLFFCLTSSQHLNIYV